jgi:hypothetical protein
MTEYEMRKIILRYVDIVDTLDALERTNKEEMKSTIKKLICEMNSIRDDCAFPGTIVSHLQILEAMLKGLDD